MDVHLFQSRRNIAKRRWSANPALLPASMGPAHFPLRQPLRLERSDRSAPTAILPSSIKDGKGIPLLLGLYGNARPTYPFAKRWAVVIRCQAQL